MHVAMYAAIYVSVKIAYISLQKQEFHVFNFKGLFNVWGAQPPRTPAGVSTFPSAPLPQKSSYASAQGLPISHYQLWGTMLSHTKPCVLHVWTHIPWHLLSQRQYK